MLHLWIFVCITLVDFTEAPVAELVDAADLKSVDRKVVPVQVRPGAPFILLENQALRLRAKAEKSGSLIFLNP